MSSIRVALAVVLLGGAVLCGLGGLAPAVADVTTGEIAGTVLTADGAPLPGALVEAASDKLMGTMTVTTDEHGEFLLLLLPPGDYALTVRAPGFGERAVSAVPVRLGRTTTVEPVRLALPRFAEEVAVTAARPLLDTASTTIGGNLAAKVFAALPVGRAYQTIAALVPGVTLDLAEYDPDRLKDTPSFLGSSVSESSYIVDGMATTEPVWGNNGTQLTFSFIDEIEVLSGGYQAEYGRSTGGIINVITRSGGNELSGSAYVFFNSYGMNGGGRWKASRGNEIDWIGKQYADYGADLGGALRKDTLWFFLAYNPAIEESRSKGYLGQQLKGRQRTDHYAAKLTWTLAPARRLVLSLFGDPKRFEGPWSQSVGNGSPASYQYADERGGQNAVLKYTGVTLSDRLLLDATAGRHDQTMHMDPLLADATTTPHLVYYWADPAAHGDSNPLHTGGYEDGAPWFWLSYETVRTSAEARATYFLGSHQLKAGLGLERITGSSFENYPGYEWRVFYDESCLLSRLETIGDSKTVNTSFFVQDSWQPTARLSVNAGLRFDQQELYGIARTRFLKLGRFSDPGNGWSPRLGIVYDVLGEGRSKLFASFARCYESMPAYINLTVFGYGTMGSYDYPYGTDGRPFTSDDPPRTVLFEWDNQANPVRIQPGLEPQYLDEIVLGYEWTLAANWTAGIKGVHRQVKRVIEDMQVPQEGGFLWLLGRPGHGLWPRSSPRRPEPTRGSS
ncbi:MAG: TonB-dependent receptor [Acidobacteriota bacterium]